MTKKQLEFTEQPCTSNTQWATQEMLTQLTPAARARIAFSLRKLDKVLYKSWAKDLSLTELIEAVNMIP